MALRTEMINFFGPDIIDDVGDEACIGQVAVVQEESRGTVMRIHIDVVDSLRVERAGSANDAVDFIVFRKKQFCQIRAVLTCDAGNERLFQCCLVKK